MKYLIRKKDNPTLQAIFESRRHLMDVLYEWYPKESMTFLTSDIEVSLISDYKGKFGEYKIATVDPYFFDDICNKMPISHSENMIKIIRNRFKGKAVVFKDEETGKENKFEFDKTKIFEITDKIENRVSGVFIEVAYSIDTIDYYRLVLPLILANKKDKKKQPILVVFSFGKDGEKIEFRSILKNN